MAKSVASADRSKTPAASSNERSTWPSYEVLRTERQWTGEYWNAQCCKSQVPYPFTYVQFSDGAASYNSETPPQDYPWLCEECARKHSLIW